MKRLFDLTAVIVTLPVTVPVLLVIAFVVRVASTGPVLYRSRRYGRGGHLFTLYKFRTLRDAPSTSPSTADDDPRMTRLGLFLRRTKLDELPQLWNVLKGDMSLVGPRPHTPADVATWSERQREHLSEILTARPGITDWATLWIGDEGARLRGAIDPHQTYLDTILPTKLNLQLAYVRTHDLLNDLYIIVWTIWLGLLRSWSKET